MLSSIKSKIIALTVSLLCVLSITVTSASLIAFYRDKELVIAANDVSITSFEGKMNAEIAELEKNALDLALMGDIYYQRGKVQSIGDFLTKSILHNYPNSMGNGIYFEPYQIDKNKKIFCIHALWNNNHQTELLPSCLNGTFDYFKQNWYAEIKKDMALQKRVSWVRPYKSTQLGNLMTTVGAGIYDQNKLVGMATVDWELDTILKSILQIKPTPHSFVLFADKNNDYIIATTEPNVNNGTIMGKSLKEVKWYSADLKEGIPFTYNGKQYIPYIKQLNNGFFLIVNVPRWELFNNAVQHLRILLTVLLISSFVIVLILYMVLKNNINKPISKLTAIAREIGNGNLNLKILLDKPDELADLASVFNQMTADIKNQIVHLAKVSSEKEKIEAELNIAHTIQSSALPKDFPQNDYLNLIASMTPAREVGGDFYDFFPIDENHFAFVMADVSGKGITAALYMMSAKSIIKNMLQSGYPLTEAADKINQGLCDNHVRGMFVTAFVGILDLRTGQVDYINAGHCPPLHATKTGYAYISVVRNLVFGITPNYKYEKGSFMLKPNDRLFLYTDGVTEAQTETEKLFGPDRLQKALNQKRYSLPDTLTYLRKKIDRFVRGAAQSDDITMMILEFRHKKK